MHGQITSEAGSTGRDNQEGPIRAMGMLDMKDGGEWDDGGSGARWLDGQSRHAKLAAAEVEPLTVLGLAWIR
ncbi:hypothetical protein N7510_003429 [Penicillium lagena]|uniref:uncharacterized protein n=1 Tax=Penicillium lagena TaxID=94218 RepID=UPI0025423C91|nr:uncharacterized protein N7510_003429 [Penicillium lagena]KAJ5619445.1 hypothetical protein N7510_003429 [Penicillium lagena]